MSKDLEARLSQVLNLYEELVLEQRAQAEKHRQFLARQQERMEPGVDTQTMSVEERIANRRDEAIERSKTIYEGLRESLKREADFHTAMLRHLEDQTSILRAIEARLDAQMSPSA